MPVETPRGPFGVLPYLASISLHMIWPCKRLDFTWADWLFAFRRCLWPPRRESVAARVEDLWSAKGDAIACLTVRSAFDLYLRAKQWRAGDEIIFSALTVSDMPRIARQHGLRVVPLDIDPLTARWDERALERRIGPRTRAVVLTHLFGARLDVEPAAAIARRHGVAVVEDCAQAYSGPDQTGHPRADLTLFSFGPMKIATALGGGLARVPQAEVRASMRALLEQDALQPTREFARRVLLYGVLKAASNPSVYGGLVALAESLGLHRERWIHGLTRNVPGDGLMSHIRRRPCASLLSLLERRLQEGDAPIARRAAPGAAFFRALGQEVQLPTRDAYAHAYWIVPVLVRNREELKDGLRRHGFDAMSERLSVVSEGGTEAPGARRLSEVLYLPFDPGMPESELERLGALVTRLVAREREGTAQQLTMPASITRALPNESR